MAYSDAVTALPAAKARAQAAIEGASAALRALSLAIHGEPELGFEELSAHRLLTDFLEGAGFAVRRHAYGLTTAFEATAGSGGPRVAVFCEYDALPEIGHACGHNLIAMAGVAAGLGVQAALGEAPGTIVVLGSPAEEGGGGKIRMMDEGALDGVDAALMVHPAANQTAWASVIAIEQLRLEYFGKAAHASAAPWLGVNALDAMVQAYNNVAMLRQQLLPSDRVHGVITHGGNRPNIIPDYTSSDWYVRAATEERREDVRAKVIACFEAAASASGCTMEVQTQNLPYSDLVTNDAMAEAFVANARALGWPLPDKAPTPAWASTDMGNVSYRVPSIHPLYRIPTDAPNHSVEFTECAATDGAHEATLRAATAMAWTALDLLLDGGLLARAKAEFAGR